MDPRARLDVYRQRGLLSLEQYLNEIEALAAQHDALDAAAMGMADASSGGEHDEERHRVENSVQGENSGREESDDEDLVDEEGRPFVPAKRPRVEPRPAHGSDDDHEDGPFDDDHEMDGSDDALSGIVVAATQ